MDTILEQIRNNNETIVTYPDLTKSDWRKIFTEIGRSGNIDTLHDIKKCYDIWKTKSNKMPHINMDEYIKLGAVENDNLEILQKFENTVDDFESCNLHYNAGKFGAKKCCKWLNDSDYSWFEQNEAMMCGASDGNHVDICEMIVCRQCRNKWIIALISATLHDNNKLYEYAFKKCFKEKNIRRDCCALYGLLLDKCDHVYDDINNFHEKTEKLRRIADKLTGNNKIKIHEVWFQ